MYMEYLVANGSEFLMAMLYKRAEWTEEWIDIENSLWLVIVSHGLTIITK